MQSAKHGYGLLGNERTGFTGQKEVKNWKNNWLSLPLFRQYFKQVIHLLTTRMCKKDNFHWARLEIY